MTEERTYAGHYKGATATLESIATHYVGEPVLVRWIVNPSVAGMARRCDGRPIIEIEMNLPAGRLGHTFFHECGHHAHGHVKIESPLEKEYRTPTAELLAKLTPNEQTFFAERIDCEESEANDFAKRALAGFEEKFGPFLEALGG